MLYLVIYWLVNQPYCLLKLIVMFHWHRYSVNISPSLRCLCWCVHFQKRQLTARLPRFAAGTHSPCNLLEKAGPPNFAYAPWVLLRLLGRSWRLVTVGCWLYRPRRAWLPSQNCCTPSSGSLDLWMCMHALRPINEKKVITVCGGGKLQGQRMPTARGPAQNCWVCAENKMGIRALLCNLPKRHSEGTTPPF